MQLELRVRFWWRFCSLYMRVNHSFEPYLSWIAMTDAVPFSFSVEATTDPQCMDWTRVQNGCTTVGRYDGWRDGRAVNILRHAWIQS